MTINQVPDKNAVPLYEKWIDLCFLAEAEKQGFAEARLITLKSYYYDVISQYVIKNYCLNILNSKPTSQYPYDAVEEKTKEIMNAGMFKVKEFIDTTDGDTTICLNRNDINEYFIYDAMNKLLSVGEVKTNQHYVFGQAVTFKANEIQFINKH